jgi:hypothetical protein
MARLRTWGSEASIQNDVNDRGSPDPGYRTGSDGVSTRQGTVVRSGGFAGKHDTTIAGIYFTRITLLAAESVAGRKYFGRIYMRFDNAPTGSTAAVSWADNIGGTLATIQLTAGGKLQLWIGVSSQVGSDSVETISFGDGKFHRIEFAIMTNTGSTDELELRLNGQQVAVGTGLNVSDSLPGQFLYGLNSGTAGTGKVAYSDDGAINDDQGANQNAFPGEGKVVLLLPISDSARAAKWTTNAGTTTTNFNAVDNTPPVGIAVNTTPDNAYEKHAGTAAGTTDAYDANMTTYTTAGIVSTDRITLVQGVLVTGEEIITGAKNLSFECLSNPVISSTGSFDVAPVSGAQGTWPTAWHTKWGPATYNPAPTLGTSPVMRVIRPETATRVASVAFMGLYVEYVNSVKSPPIYQRRWRFLKRGRSL